MIGTKGRKFESYAEALKHYANGGYVQQAWGVYYLKEGVPACYDTEDGSDTAYPPLYHESYVFFEWIPAPARVEFADVDKMIGEPCSGAWVEHEKRFARLLAAEILAQCDERYARREA